MEALTVLQSQALLVTMVWGTCRMVRYCIARATPHTEDNSN